MRFINASFPALLATCLALAGTGAQAQSITTTPRPHESVRGQPGTGVMWIATPQPLVDKTPAAARVTPQDRLFDFGAGDGVVAITAARQFGATVVGIEYNVKLAEHARRRVREAGVSGMVSISTGDIFKDDFSAATVVTMYLLSELNLQLRPTLLEMKPGTRIVSHDTDMGEWLPEKVIAYGTGRAQLWIVPARVEGEWTFTGLEAGPARIRLRES